MANTIYKRKLSGSTDWTWIKVVQTATAWTTIHTAVAWTTAWTFDEIWLWAYNGHTTWVTLTIEFWWATVPDQNIVVDIPAKAWLFPVVAWLILQNTLVVKAFAWTGNVITLSWFVNTMTDA